MTTTIWMSPTGDDTNPGTKDQPKATFSAAYAELPNGGTVRLHAGTYDFMHEDNPPNGVTLIGAGRGTRPRSWWRRVLRRRRSATILKRPS